MCHIIDRDIDTEDEIATHKSGQCDGLTKNLTEEYDKSFVEKIYRIRRNLEALSNQLYAQSTILTRLVRQTIELATHFYAQRRPRELANFTWIIDRKDPQKITKQENWWKETLGPLIQTESLSAPLALVDDSTFNFTYFRKNFMFDSPIYIGNGKYEDHHGFDIGLLITKNTSFLDSRDELLLQAIDVLAGFIRRALRGDFEESEIISALGRLQIIHLADEQRQVVYFLSFGKSSKNDPALGKRLRLMTEHGRTMFPPTGEHKFSFK